MDLATEMPQMQFGSTITNYKSAQLVTLKVPKGITTVCGISGHCYSARGGVIRVPEQDAASAQPRFSEDNGVALCGRTGLT